MYNAGIVACISLIINMFPVLLKKCVSFSLNFIGLKIWR